MDAQKFLELRDLIKTQVDQQFQIIILLERLLYANEQISLSLGRVVEQALDAVR